MSGSQITLTQCIFILSLPCEYGNNGVGTIGWNHSSHVYSNTQTSECVLAIKHEKYLTEYYPFILSILKVNNEFRLANNVITSMHYFCHPFSTVQYFFHHFFHSLSICFYSAIFHFHSNISYHCRHRIFRH